MRTLAAGFLAVAAMTLCVLTAAAQPPERRERGEGPPRGSPDGPGGASPRFELGRVLPPHAREELKLTKDQEEKIAELEKEVKERLAKVLTAEQKKKLQELGPPQPGGPPAGEPGRPREGRRPDRPGRGAEGERGERPGRPPEGERPARPPEGERPARPPEGERGERPARPPEGGRPGAEAPDGPRGPGGRLPRFELGHVIPPFAREELKLTKDQSEEIAKLEKEVKERLSKILTAEQKKQLEDLRPPQPGGPGGRPGGGRSEGPGRPPEGGRPD